LSKYNLDEYYLLGANQWQGFVVTVVLLVPQALIAGVLSSDIGMNIERGAECQFGNTPPGYIPCDVTYATHVFIFTNILWTIRQLLWSLPWEQIRFREPVNIIGAHERTIYVYRNASRSSRSRRGTQSDW